MTDSHTHSAEAHSRQAHAHQAHTEEARRTEANRVEDVRTIGQLIAKQARDQRLQKALQALRTKEQLEAFIASAHRLELGSLVVAILGQQGIGKSSMINAIIGRRVLPMDEMETTNVPCRLVGVDAEGERAEVCFADGHVERGAATSEYIGQFSDEQQNPKNERGATEMRVYLDCPLLTSGVELVDTPGVGSLTEHTEKATMEFLSKVSLAIFVVSSSPTLRAGEARFLSAIYRHVRQFIFVQNPWSSDDPRDIADGFEDNRRKLEEIARDHHVDEIEFLSVDVHAGLEGAMNGRPEDVESSGLAELRLCLDARLAEGAAKVLVKTEAGMLGLHAKEALRDARTKRAHLEAAGEESAAKYERAKQEKEAELRQIEATWQAKTEEFSADVEALVAPCEQRIAEGLKQAREAIVPLIKRRKLSGEAIGEALDEQVSLRIESAVDALQDAYAERVQELLGSASELAESARFDAGPAAGQGVRGTESSEFWESAGRFTEGLGKLGLAVIGGEAVWAAGAALLAGEGLGVAIGLGAAAIPVIGAAVAGVVLLVGWWVRSSAREKVIRKIVAQVDELLARLGRELPPKIRAGITEHSRKAIRQLDELLAREVGAQRELMQGISDDYQQDAAKRGEHAALMRDHAEALMAFLKMLTSELSAFRDTPKTATAAAQEKR